MNNIQMIPIRRLIHHPENPRKDLGDLTELAESIKANGVMQNLTVVPDMMDGTIETGRYRVVIGNRRMEAAKMAGLEELPCVISDMDHRTQVATMLMENMQRADLTVYEQAQGFQMMMDLGFKAGEIAEKTGFSETTVNRRLKMAELDKATFEKACAKQITIDDLDKLGKIKSIKQRNALLKNFGDSNFNWEVNRALQTQKAHELKPAAMAMIREAKLEKLPDGERYSGKYQQLYNKTLRIYDWDGKSDFIPKAEGKLFYNADETTVEFFLKETKTKAEPVRQTEEEKEEERQIELAWKTVDRITEASYSLRKNFAEELKVSPKNAMEMLQWALIATLCADIDYESVNQVLRKEKILEGYNTQDNLVRVREWIKKESQSRWPAVIMMICEGDKAGKNGYADGTRKERPKYRKNSKLDFEYEWLTQFGYQMSDEEIQMMAGTHTCFQTKMEGLEHEKTDNAG